METRYEGLTFQDVLRSRLGEEAYARMQLDARKSKSGCVIRSLESLTGAQATDAEYIQRLEVVEQAPDIVDIAINTPNPADIPTVLLNEREKDVQEILKLIKNLRRGDSPLAKALQELEVTRVRSNSTNVNDRLASGDAVVIISYNHMLHIGLSPEGKFVSLSDDRIPVKLGETTTYDTLIFTKSTNQQYRPTGC